METAMTLRAAEPPSSADAAVAMEKVLVDVIARNDKSVVAIARVRKEAAGETLQPEFRPDPFGRRPTPLSPPQPNDPDFIPNEYGAGVVVDRAGLILTAYQLLGDESDYYVTTADHKIYKATVKGADPRSDLAVLSIEATDLTPITLGNAAELKKGQIVISLGNPHAIARDGQPSAAWGIVSNLGRKAPATPGESDPSGRPTLHHYGTLIQTDTKLGLGTGGGPLLNLKGEMVGLGVVLPAAGYEAAGGYAIPVDGTFRRAMETLKQGREVEYGFLGVQPANLRPQETLAGLHGMRVNQVVPGTPALRYGLKPGDIVTAVDNTPIYDADGLVLNVGKLPAETVTRLSVLRGGSRADGGNHACQICGSRQEDRHLAQPGLAWAAGRVSDRGRGRREPRRWRHVVRRRRRDRGRSGRRVAGLGCRPASGDVDHAGRWGGGPHAKTVRSRGGPQSRPRQTSHGRRRKNAHPHGAAGDVGGVAVHPLGSGQPHAEQQRFFCSE